jgi:lysophospholipase L1-like esterase
MRQRGGASALDLLAQAAAAEVGEEDLVVVSVGTNDAAPWKRVPVAVFVQVLTNSMESVPGRRWIYVAPPGVDEARLTRPGDRTNAIVDSYREAALSVCGADDARVVRTERIIKPLGASSFVNDGLHLSGPAYKVVLPEIASAIFSAG